MKNIIKKILHERTNTKKLSIAGAYHQDIDYPKQVYKDILNAIGLGNNLQIKEHLVSGTRSDIFLLDNMTVMKVSRTDNSNDIKFYNYFYDNPSKYVIPIYQIYEDVVVFVPDWDVELSFNVILMPYATNYCKATDEEIKYFEKNINEELVNKDKYKYIIDLHKCNIGIFNGRKVVTDGDLMY